MHHQFRNVGEASEPVELHIRVQHAAARQIHNLLFKQGIADAHDQRTQALALSRLEIDDQAAVLHRHHLLDFHDTGLDIDFDFGHLYATNTASGEVWRLDGIGIPASHCDRHDSQLRTGLFPAQRVVGIVLHTHRAVHALELVRRNIEHQTDLGEKNITRIDCCAPRRGTDGTYR